MANPFLGEIRLLACNFAPVGWAFCQGQLLPINQNTALFSLLGTTYGGNGISTFALPDLRGCVPIGFGQGPGLSNHSLGERGGAESVTLTNNQMPAHTHSAMARNDGGNQQSPVGNVPAAEAAGVTAVYSNQAPNASMSTQAIANTGGGLPHTNLQPYVTLNYCIALQGIFPSPA